MGLTLRDGNREYFYKKLDEHFPNLKYKYMKTYGNKYEVNSLFNNDLMKLFYEVTSKNGIKTDIKELFSYMHEFPKGFKQLSLFED